MSRGPLHACNVTSPRAEGASSSKPRASSVDVLACWAQCGIGGRGGRGSGGGGGSGRRSVCCAPRAELALLRPPHTLRPPGRCPWSSVWPGVAPVGAELEPWGLFPAPEGSAEAPPSRSPARWGQLQRPAPRWDQGGPTSVGRAPLACSRSCESGLFRARRCPFPSLQAGLVACAHTQGPRGGPRSSWPEELGPGWALPHRGAFTCRRRLPCSSTDRVQTVMPGGQRIGGHHTTVGKAGPGAAGDRAMGGTMLRRGTVGRPGGSRPGGATGSDGGPGPGRGWGAYLPSLLVTRLKVPPPQAPARWSVFL